MPYKKLSARRLAQYSGPRRRKPPLRKQANEVRDLVEQEHELLQALIRDADRRRAMWLGAGRRPEPLVVWTDFDHTYLETELDPRWLQPWEQLSEYMKIQLGFLVALELGGYSFTVNVPKEVEADWKAKGRKIERMIQRRLSSELAEQGLGDLPFVYAIESRSRTTRSRTHLHIHGFLLADSSLVATGFKVASEKALLHLRDRWMGRKSDFDIQPVYDLDTGDGRGRGRWPAYFLKSINRWDARVPGRRVFISRPLTQTAREFWELLRMDVVASVPGRPDL